MATNLTTLFTNIANAIRVKTGGTEQIVAENFPTEILQMWGKAGTAYVSGATSTLQSDVLKTTAKQYRVVIVMNGELRNNSTNTVVAMMFLKNKSSEVVSNTFMVTFNNGAITVVHTAQINASVDTTSGTVTLTGEEKFNASSYMVLMA